MTLSDAPAAIAGCCIVRIAIATEPSEIDGFHVHLDGDRNSVDDCDEPLARNHFPRSELLAECNSMGRDRDRLQDSAGQSRRCRQARGVAGSWEMRWSSLEEAAR